MNEVQKEMAAIALKHGKALAIEMIEVVALPALDAAVKKSETPLDDIAVAALKEPLKNAIKELLSKVEL